MTTGLKWAEPILGENLRFLIVYCLRELKILHIKCKTLFTLREDLVLRVTGGERGSIVCYDIVTKGGEGVQKCEILCYVIKE